MEEPISGPWAGYPWFWNITIGRPVGVEDLRLLDGGFDVEGLVSEPTAAELNSTSCGPQCLQEFAPPMSVHHLISLNFF